MQKKLPERMCIACHGHKPKKELIRVVRAKDGSLSLDTTGKAEGRGAYVCRNAVCLETAYKKRALERTFKMPVGAEMYEQLKERMSEACDGE